MNAAVTVLLVVVLVSSGFSVPVQRGKRWSVHQTVVEPAPGLSRADLRETLATAPHIRYTDKDKHLTALKNVEFKSCFIVDLDLDFYLSEPEMDDITTKRAPQVIATPPAYYAFLKKAGPLLTAMCERMDIYWLNAAEATPLSNEVQPPIRLPEPGHVTSHPTNHNPLTPPPVALYRQQQAGRTVKTPPSANHNPPTPPPVALYRQQQAGRTVKTPPSANHNPPTPPPVALYRQQ
ncbi:uncharacterized protein LOC143275508 [Babylonia areolata]|uniref:uncharacterized protein LOC143275508 n=1 Tax=Babylonia areolata TaxID=304850 RepID=UPI003FCFDF44